MLLKMEITYKFKGKQYTQMLYAKNLRTARHKLAVQHKAVLQAIKIIDMKEMEG